TAMSRFIDTMERSGAWLWQHTAAGLALILIVLALLIGYQLGAPPKRAEETAGAPALTAGGEPQMYTCSMHPSVRLPDPDAKCPICCMDLIPVRETAGGDGADARRVSIDPAAARIETAQVGRFFPTAEVRLYGKVTYDETAVARLTAWFPGRIDRLFV